VKIYVIENDRGQRWSNEFGWVRNPPFDIWELNAPQLYNLPIGGKWVEYNLEKSNSGLTKGD